MTRRPVKKPLPAKKAPSPAKRPLKKKAPSREEEIRKILVEVEQAVEHRSNDWQQLQNRIISRMREYQKMEALRSAIYNTYSREDRQPPDVPYRHLKTAAKIAEEIYLNRFGGKKLRGGQLRDILPRPEFTVYDVSDILGITIVCPFDADVDRVIEQIEADCKGGSHFRAIGKIKRHDRRDYQAVHVSLTVSDRRLRELQCEVQIKTAVQDAFSWKTHALAYKPGSDADPWYIEQFVRVSVLLRTADGISDQLRGRLEEGRSVSSRKRRAVRSSLLLVFREHIAKIGSDGKPAKKRLAKKQDEKKRDLERVFDQLGKNMLLKAGKNRRAALDNIRRQVEGVFGTYGYDPNTFRLGVLCAIAPDDDGFLSQVDLHFHRWIAESDPANKQRAREKLEDWTRSANLLAIAHYFLNDIVGAIQMAETALRRAGEVRSTDIGQLHVNLAYYCAEQAGDASGSNYGSKAQMHAQKARDMLGKDIGPADMDSLGFVRIATGASIGEVEGGLADCRRVFEELSKDKRQSALARDIFEIHRELAYKRLSQMVSVEPVAQV